MTTRALLVLFVLATLAAPLNAHQGPPFPVLVDEVEPPWSISIWADPDVGTGTFFVQLQPAEGASLPADTRVTVFVQPADGRVEETRWVAEREDWKYGEQHIAKVDFPTREFWLVRTVVESESAGRSVERTLRVEVTPPGYGPIDLLLYLWPFLAIAVLWIKAILKRRSAERSAVPAETPPRSVHS
jgi:hypothetical protein